MRYRTVTAALTAVALVWSPMPAFAQSMPQPAVSQEEGLQLSHEPDHRRKKRRLLLWLILGGVAAAIAAYLLLHDGDEDPVSP